jgi:hypothetical protein
MVEALEYASRALAADSFRTSPFWNSAKYLLNKKEIINTQSKNLSGRKTTIREGIGPVVVSLHFVVEDLSLLAVGIWDEFVLDDFENVLQKNIKKIKMTKQN